ncbi:MAG: hypothetical protein ACHRHE_12150 [Tepidisphaerales bacterium]
MLLLAFGHMVVDATSIFAATRIATPATIGYDRAVGVILAYGLLAFAVQPLIGWAIDRWRIPTIAAAIGGLMAAAAALLCETAPMPALWLAGLGNALFHVGAGSICLQLARGTSAMPGVFVAPGDIGVILGTYTGRGDWGGIQFIIAACVLSGFLVATIRCHTHVSPARRVPDTGPMRLGVALALLFLAVAVRSCVGGVVTAPWLDAPAVWIGIAAAATLAKVAGVIADRVGWIAFAVPCVLLAAPLTIHASTPASAMAAMFLVQCAMPVTLAGMARVLPDRPALTFGLASMAIAFGAVPAQISGAANFSHTLLLTTQFGCAAAIFAALLLLRPRIRPSVLSDGRGAHAPSGSHHWS